MRINETHLQPVCNLSLFFTKLKLCPFDISNLLFRGTTIWKMIEINWKCRLHDRKKDRRSDVLARYLWSRTASIVFVAICRCFFLSHGHNSQLCQRKEYVSRFPASFQNSTSAARRIWSHENVPLCSLTKRRHSLGTVRCAATWLVLAKHSYLHEVWRGRLLARTIYVDTKPL